jgi:hypothetical protein
VLNHFTCENPTGKNPLTLKIQWSLAFDKPIFVHKRSFIKIITIMVNRSHNFKIKKFSGQLHALVVI